MTAAGGAAVPAQPTITVTLGPGPYTEDLLGQLADRGLLHRAIRSWPEFTVDRWNASRRGWERMETLAWYAYLVRGVWATWRRVPRLGRRRTPQALLFSLFDRMAAKRLGDPMLFVGWSQLCLQSLRVTRLRGAVAALEHPMLHIDTWQETMLEEYARYAPDAAEYYSLFPPSLVRRMRAEYNEADYIVVPSAVVRETFVTHGVSSERLVEIPFGVDTDYFRPGQGLDSSRFRVAFLGRLELLKGVHYLLDAWASIALKGASLALAGPILPEIREILSRATREGRVEVMGQVSREGIRTILAESDAVVFPSICDAFGLVILEAMASGRPVIATSRSAGPEIIEDGVDGFVVPPKDPRAIAERLEWLYLHREECAEMGRRARLKVEGRYGLVSYGDRLARAYSQMLATGRSLSPSISVGKGGI